MASPHEQQAILLEQTGKLVTTIPSEIDGAGKEYITSNDGKRPAFRRFLENEIYAEAISSLVTKTVDVVIYDPETGRMLVVTRNQEPQRGDFIAGGRKQSGKSDMDDAIRILKNEFGEDVAALVPDRLQRVDKATYDMIWDSREQDATVNEAGQKVTGSHQDSTLYALPVPEARFNAIARPNAKMIAGTRWEDAFDIIDAPEGKYHPTFQDMIFDTLEHVVTHPGDA